MPKPTAVDTERLTERLTQLLAIPSPTGWTDHAERQVADWLGALGLPAEWTPKGGLLARWEGEAEATPRCLTAHVDTLGAMVKEFQASGRPRLTGIGGLQWASLDGEGCTIHTQDGRQIRGTILVDMASAHVHGDEGKDRPRSAKTMEVRLDAPVDSEQASRQLGLQVGDFVSIDPRTETGPAGFIRSRFLDDKAGAACLLESAAAILESHRRPAQTTYLHFSNYEEVGHGASADIPDEVKELVAVDMAAVGQGQASQETCVTICVKDSGGPYHYGLSSRLRRLAEQGGIDCRLDIYPHYRSDGSAHWFAGGRAQVALIGPGIDASHHYERTHVDGLAATCQLLTAYLLS